LKQHFDWGGGGPGYALVKNAYLNDCKRVLMRPQDLRAGPCASTCFLFCPHPLNCYATEDRTLFCCHYSTTVFFDKQN